MVSELCRPLRSLLVFAERLPRTHGSLIPVSIGWSKLLTPSIYYPPPTRTSRHWATIQYPGWWVHCCADTSPFGGPCNCSVTARSFAWRWWYILLSEDNLELWQLSYVFADCVDWVELLSARMHVFYSRRMSLPTSSTELNCCIGKETRHNSFRQISSTVVLCLCGLLRLSWIVV